MGFTIRKTTPADFFETELLTREAFWDIFKPGCDEHLALHQLRESGDYLPELDYLAELDGRIVGHILYSKSRLIGEDGTQTPMVSFGPLSVLPEHQGMGIGGALIEHTRALARQQGYRGIFIYGHETYYPRFGFQNAQAFGVTTPDGKNFDAFMGLPLWEGSLDGLSGKLYESAAFACDSATLEAFEMGFPAKEKRFREKKDS